MPSKYDREGRGSTSFTLSFIVPGVCCSPITFIVPGVCCSPIIFIVPGVCCSRHAGMKLKADLHMSCSWLHGCSAGDSHGLALEEVLWSLLELLFLHVPQREGYFAEARFSCFNFSVAVSVLASCLLLDFLCLCLQQHPTQSVSPEHAATSSLGLPLCFWLEHPFMPPCLSLCLSLSWLDLP